MAERRMFARSITSSSQFLMMPQSSQNLYFHLGMNADDDGFCEHFSVIRMIAAQPDDLAILRVKGYVFVFDEKVLLIMQWKENNFIRSDRYKPSKYFEVYKQNLAQLREEMNNQQLGIPFGIPTVDQRSTQGRGGEVRRDEVIYTQKVVDNPDKLWKDGDTIKLKDCTAIRRYGEWVDLETHVKLNRNHYKDLP